VAFGTRRFGLAAPQWAGHAEVRMDEGGKRDIKFVALAAFGLAIGIAILAYSVGWRP